LANAQDSGSSLTSWGPQEFDNLKDGETVYKLVGPILLKQDKADAEGTVNGRLSFIEKELYVAWNGIYRMALTQSSERLDTQIKEIQEKLEKIKGEILKIQAGAQQGPAVGGSGKQAVKA